MPIIGRLMITSIRLPIHMLATMPQNRSGRLVITAEPGWMPWIIIAPIISAMMALDGKPERQQRNERGLRRRVVGRLRSGHAFDRALAEAATGSLATFFSSV